MADWSLLPATVRFINRACNNYLPVRPTSSQRCYQSGQSLGVHQARICVSYLSHACHKFTSGQLITFLHCLLFPSHHHLPCLRTDYGLLRQTSNNIRRYKFFLTGLSRTVHSRTGRFTVRFVATMSSALR